MLSHLFKQGTNAAEVFRSSAEFRSQVARRIESMAGKDERAAFESSIGKRWTVEFRIADHVTSSGDFNIPFFSRLSFGDEKKRLIRMGYNVSIGFIKLKRVT